MEAKEKSGTFITVDMALEQGREVYAVPGRTTDALSAGCNRLINQGAGILYNIEDFIKELRESYVNLPFVPGGMYGALPESEAQEPQRQKSWERSVLAKIDFYPKTLQKIYDELNGETKWEEDIALNKVMAALMNLEKSGKIQVQGNYYMIKS